MDPAIAAIDLVKAGAIAGSMVESCLAATVPPPDAKGADDDNGQNHTGAASVADGLRLYPAIGTGAGPLQSGEYRAPVQSGQQGAVARMEPAAHPDPGRDLGQSGSRITNREDFKSLVSDVAMGNAGAIFSLEASRLARSNQDWHRLLELCAITGTLVTAKTAATIPPSSTTASFSA